MDFFTVDRDHEWKIGERAYFDHDRIVLENRQDVTAILDQNKRDFNRRDGLDRALAWRTDIVHVARVPLVILHDLVKQGILTRGYKPVGDRFDNWLNDPDNRMFRTLPGRV